MTTSRFALTLLVLAMAPFASAMAAEMAASAPAPATAVPAGPMTKDQYKAAKSTIAETYTADKKGCVGAQGNALDICKAQSKAKEKNALADLEYQYTGKPTDQQKAAKVHAETDYAVAKEKCDDLKGNDKDVCVKEAKAVEVKAIANITASQKGAVARNDATKEKNEANYKVAIAKCDALAGAAKDTCVADAKAKYGM
jgi:uncharacterized protein (UPF0333 family)